MDPNPSWFLQDEWNGIEAKVRHVKLQQDKEVLVKHKKFYRKNWNATYLLFCL